MKRIIVLVAAVLCIGASPAALPKFAHGTNYNKVRASLIKQGWKPLALAGGKCNIDSCPHVPELLWCTGVGAEAPCLYAWKKGNVSIMVTGGGEGYPQSFLALKRCASITRDPQHSVVWNCN